MKNHTKTAAQTTERFSRMGMVAYFLRGCFHYFMLSLAAAIGFALLQMIIPSIVRTTVDSVIGDNPLSLPAFLGNGLERIGGAAYLRTHLYLIAITVFALGAVTAVVRYFRDLWNSKGAEHLQQNMRDSLYTHIQNLPFSWHMKNKTGDIIQRCTSDVERVRQFIAEQLTEMINILITMVVSLFFMFRLDVRLTWIAVVFIPIIVGFSLFYFGKFQNKFQECDVNEGILSTIAQENLTGVRVVRAFGREEYERQRFEKQNVYYTGLWVHLMKMMSFFWSANDLIAGVQALLVLVLGTAFTVHGDITTGSFIAFVTYNSMLMWPVRELGRVISDMSKASVSIDRIRYIMNSEEEHDLPGAVEPDMHGDIVFDHVTFGYTNDKPIVKDISFTIKGGSTFGILGSTGSGKSTLMHLLTRLYDLPEDCGRITIGGTDIRNAKAAYLRRNIGMVLQEPFLFSRSIKDNIGIIDPKMPERKIYSAARMAHIDEAISDFKNGYDTMVGERGVTLSGGQKQRTAIARMLTEDSPVMVFDDSLSAVDAETDARIREDLHEHLSRRTTILIAHRVSTLMQADQIIVMDKGRILEKGSPAELLSRDTIFKRIHDMQMTLSDEGMAGGSPFDLYGDGDGLNLPSSQEENQ